MEAALERSYVINHIKKRCLDHLNVIAVDASSIALHDAIFPEKSFECHLCNNMIWDKHRLVLSTNVLACTDDGSHCFIYKLKLHFHNLNEFWTFLSIVFELERQALATA